MHIAVELPEDIAGILKAARRDLPRGLLEAVAVEGYLSFWKTEAFLAERRAYLPYTEEDLQQDCGDVDRGRRP
jgi:hypothetical protein